MAATAGAVDLATLAVHVAGHALDDQLDVGRILADVGVLELVHGRLDRGAEGVERALPHAIQTFVGVDPHEEPVLPGIAHEERVDATDAHA